MTRTASEATGTEPTREMHTRNRVMTSEIKLTIITALGRLAVLVAVVLGGGRWVGMSNRGSMCYSYRSKDGGWYVLGVSCALYSLWG